MEKFVYPKRPPVLTPAQQKAREDFMMLWHETLPQKYDMIEKFNHGTVSAWPLQEGCKTLEIGAGIGAHAKFEDLKNQDYYFLEYREEFCKVLERSYSEDKIIQGDIQKKQPFEDGAFDRIVAIHVLEHLPNLPLAITEIKRLLSTKGVFDLVMPCEGGLAYSLARKISAERLFKKRFKMDYTPIIKNEHVSEYDEILRELKKEFHFKKQTYFPLYAPIATVNLCIAIRCTPRLDS